MSSEGILAFGHDHAGHGRSEGDRAYIDTVDEYVDDMIDHCMVRKKYNNIFLKYKKFDPILKIEQFPYFLSLFYE